MRLLASKPPGEVERDIANSPRYIVGFRHNTTLPFYKHHGQAKVCFEWM